MKIVGCDWHTRYQQIAMLDRETGELIERSKRAFGNDVVFTLPYAPYDASLTTSRFFHTRSTPPA
jgi:hypothetical protein